MQREREREILVTQANGKVVYSDEDNVISLCIVDNKCRQQCLQLVDTTMNALESAPDSLQSLLKNLICMACWGGPRAA